MTISSTDIRFNPVVTNKASLQSTDVTNGSMYFVDDTKELFVDFNSQRIEVTDILILNHDSERTSILFTPLNKFYFVLDTQILWFYKDGSWYQITTTWGSITGNISNQTDLVQALASKVSTSLTINGNPLTENITLTAADIGALPSTTTIGDATITITQGGVSKGTFTVNQTSNATIELDAGSDVTIDSTLSDSSENPVQNKVIKGALDNKQDNISDISTIRTNASDAITNIGTLSNLNTTEKTNLVGAVNEVLADIPTVDSTLSTSSTNPIQNAAVANTTGSLSNLITTDKSNLTNAINEVKTDLQSLTPMGIEVASDTNGIVIIRAVTEQEVVEDLSEV